MIVLKLDIPATCKRLNSLNEHDGYDFVVRDGDLYLRDLTDQDLTLLEPLSALAAMEQANAETRNYGMPGLVLFG